MPLQPGARSRRFLWWSIWGILVLLSAAVVCPGYVNHDAAWYLHMSRVLLDGGTLYRDVIDTNPPLIVYLTVPPVWIARQLGVGDVVLFKAYVFCGAFLSLLVCAVLVRRAWASASETARALLVTVLVFLVLPFVKGDFGEREHLAVLLTLPYVLAAASWIGGQPLGAVAATLIGVAGGLGFAIKPHFLLPWIAVEVSLLSLSRGRSWRRPEPIAAAVSLVAYALVVLLFVPQYLPLAEKVRQVYGGLNSSPAVLLRMPDAQLWAAGLALLLLTRLPRTTRSISIVVFAAATGFLLAGLLQLKWWSYQLYPARAFTLLFLATFGLGLLEALPALVGTVRGGLRNIAAVVVASLFVVSGRYVLEARRPLTPDLVTALVEIVRQHAPRGPIAVLSMRTIVYPAFPLVNYTGARWSLRHNSLWFLPGLYVKELQMPAAEVPFRAPEAMPPIEREFYEQIIGDLCRNPPRLLIIEPPISRAPIGRRSLDLSAYYGQDPRYRRLSGAYRQLTTVGPFAVFTPTASASCQ
jgi:hypothetical protein